MTILVTGSSGLVGSEVVRQLVARGADVRALSRDPEKAMLPSGVAAVKGDMMDPASMRPALEGIRTLFLLAAVVPDELNQAMNTLTLSIAAGVSNFVYLSAIHADRFSNVPHFASKGAVERAIADLGIAATILRPGYFMQNEAGLKEVLVEHGTYPMALGTAGTLFVDTRDLAEIAAIELLRRDAGTMPLPLETLDVVEPELMTGPMIADMWTDALGRKVQYGGDDLDAQEQGLLQVMPGWMAYDMRLMIQRFQTDGMSVDAATHGRLRDMLGRPLRSYRQFAKETAAQWSAGA